MKDQFETKIKSVVEEFTYDYDPQAWEALSKKLPPAKPGLSWLGKFGIASLLALVVGIIGWNLAPRQDKKESIAQTKKVAPSQKATASKTTGTKKTDWKSTHDGTNAVINLKNNESGLGNVAQANSIPEQSLLARELEPFTTTEGLPSMSTPLSQEILNLKPSTRQLIESNPTPNIQISSNCQGPKIILDADAINYEDGTPRIHISAETMASDINWQVNGTVINRKNKSFDLLAFKGQTYTITAEGQLDGCKTTEKISIIANEDYNLLAVNAFNPQSRDERNATFMPYALTIREVQFSMVILDPDNGAVVFKSSDAQNAWDGIDQRTGQMVPANKAYIWKVVLQQSLPGEKSTYTGTIVRI
jgi:hypothetical protein